MEKLSLDIDFLIVEHGLNLKVADSVTWESGDVFDPHNSSVPLSFLFDVLVLIFNTPKSCLSDDAIHRFIDRYLYGSIISTMAITALLDALRVVKNNSSPNASKSLILLPIRFHEQILRILDKRMKDNDPPHWHLYGEDTCFVEIRGVSQITTKSGSNAANSQQCPTSYTLTVWIRLMEEDRGLHGFKLLSCRLPFDGGIDVLVSDSGDDGMRNMTIATSSSKDVDGKKIDSSDIFNEKVFLPSNKWILLAIRHSSNSRLDMSIDGEVKMENDLPYPFMSFQSILNSQWKLGQHFNGKVSSLAFYGELVQIPQLRLLSNLGPYHPSLLHGAVSVPQSSFDTGHHILGTVISKGKIALKACKANLIFYVTPKHGHTKSNVPQCIIGNVFVDHIETKPLPHNFDTLSFMHPSCSGSSEAVTSNGDVESLLNVGGCTVIMHLFWGYCTANRNNSSYDTSSIANICGALSLLSSLIASSTIAKEQFIQLHGFHVIGLCLGNFVSKLIKSVRSEPEEEVMDMKIIDSCVELTINLKLDLLSGDGISSALQGLLLDFRIWGEASIHTKLYLLHRICGLMPLSGDQVFKAIGIQRLLDTFRLHILYYEDTTHGKYLKSDTPKQAILQELADVCHHMLTLCLDSALTFSQTYKTKFIEPDIILKCLEETNNTLLAERILKLMLHLRDLEPIFLRSLLFEFRFHEVTAVPLLSRRSFSVQVRRDTLILITWAFEEELKQIPVQIPLLRKGSNSNANSSNNPSKGSRKQEDPTEPTTAVTKKRNALLKPILKACNTLTMLSEIVDRQLMESAWGTLDIVDMASLVEIYAHDGPLGHVYVWLALPMVHALLRQCSEIDIVSCQRLLMSQNVQLKTDDLQCEVFVNLADKSWIENFIGIASIFDAISISPSSSVYYVTSESSLSYKEVASTCVELALDSLSTVLEYKIRRYGMQADLAGMWESLQLCLTAIPSGSGFTFFSRCASLVLQRVARSSASEWAAPGTLPCVLSLITIVRDKRFCSKESLLQANGSANLVPRTQTAEEYQVMCFLLDLLASLRRASIHGSLRGKERPIFEAALSTIFSCMRIVGEAGADRISNDLLAHINFLSAAWGSPSPSYYKTNILAVMSQLCALHDDPFLSETMKNSYDSLAFSIMHYFIELRHKVAAGEFIPEHVHSTLDCMIGIENLVDVSIIYKLVITSLASEKENVTRLLSHIVPTSPGPPTGADLAPPRDEPALKQEEFDRWMTLRQGILSERVDSERARLAKCMETLDITTEAVAKFWKRLRRKVESEGFLDSHSCQWKLGVAHEGVFPGRRRVVLRPRFDFQIDVLPPDTEISESATELNKYSNNERFRQPFADDSQKALAKACVGYIKDVIREDNNGREVESSEKIIVDKGPNELCKSEAAPGSGWGIVGADESEDGYGVVGLVSDDGLGSSESSAFSSPIPQGRGFDSLQREPDDLTGITNAGSLAAVHLLEDAIKNRREIDTSPCHSRSTRRAGVAGQLIIESKVIMVTASGCFYGYLSFNGKDIYFTSSVEPCDGHLDDSAVVNAVSLRIRRRRWALPNVSAIYLRRYRLRDSALEVFFRRGKHKNFFVDFGHTKENRKQRTAFARQLMDQAPNNSFKQWPLTSPFRLVREHQGLQERWVSGKISNFDYLMSLNTISGRSFNDLCQYPIMPWVIADYESSSLDLSDPSIYRDLTKPMGALNASRLHEYLDRYNSFADNVSSDIPPFMYGSHYSTMVGVVLHFLVRLQPFAALHKEMQAGHFDVPDRLFSSVPNSFRHNTVQLSEVKELIPEFYTTPDMFRNVNNFDFGVTQDGLRVGDVELPKWASSPEEFVRINSEALESEFVSANLNHWIDLIWGYQQRGPEAEKACNVFYYLTYIDGVDRDAIEDETLRRALELQSAHFGQIPMQLFQNPHPKRRSPKKGGLKALGNCKMPSQLNKLFVKSNASSDRAKLCPEVEQTIPISFYHFLQQPRSYEEFLAAASPCSVVLRRNTGVTLQKAQPTDVIGSILSMSILPERVVCILDNGVIEAFKYTTSDLAKEMVAQYANTHSPSGSSFSESRRDMQSATSRNSEQFSSFGETAIISFEESAPLQSSNRGSSRIENAPVSLDGIVTLEKDTTHFDVLPRIPVVRAVPTQNDGSCALSPPVHCCQSGRIVISGGHADGTISVRELDVRTGFVISGGNFQGHRYRVVSIASDSIQSASTDVICSCDQEGQILIWTVSKVDGTSPNSTSYSYIISRRPQRYFRCPPSPTICCDVSWQMGIVVVASADLVSVFSIERDELLRSFCVSPVDNEPSVFSTNQFGISYTHEGKSVLGYRKEQPAIIARQIICCDDGYLIVHLIGSKEAEMLVAYSLSGRKTGVVAYPTECGVCNLTCPDRGSVVISGHQDGSVYFYRPCDLLRIGKLVPHLSCVLHRFSPGQDKSSTRRLTKPMMSSPIICVRCGPNPAAPAVITMSTASGALYFRPLPDFISWERNRSPSLVARIVSAPTQVVKDVQNHVQNLADWTKSFVEETSDVVKTEIKNSKLLNALFSYVKK